MGVSAQGRLQTAPSAELLVPRALLGWEEGHRQGKDPWAGLCRASLEARVDKDCELPERLTAGLGWLGRCVVAPKVQAPPHGQLGEGSV